MPTVVKSGLINLETIVLNLQTHYFVKRFVVGSFLASGNSTLNEGRNEVGTRVNFKQPVAFPGK